MSAEQIHMTGAELKRIKEKAGIKEADIEKRLGVKPITYYKYTNKENRDKPIPLDVENKVDTDNQLREIKNRELSGPKPDQTEILTLAIKNYGDLAGSVRATLDVVTQLLLKQESKYDTIVRNNSTLLDFLDIAKKEGEFHYQKK